MFKNLLICGLIVILLGCSGGVTREKLATLQLSIDNYIAALRWSRMAEARDFHRQRDGSRPEIDLSGTEPIRVTGYDVRRKTVDPEMTQASVTVLLEYYDNQYGTVEEVTLEQDWWYDSESGRWYLASEFPVFE